MKLWNISKYSILMHQSGGSRNFWTGDMVENIVVWGLFSNWCPFTHTKLNIFAVRVENKIYAYCTHWLHDGYKYNAFYAVKIYQNKPKFSFKQGGVHLVCPYQILLWRYMCTYYGNMTQILFPSKIWYSNKKITLNLKKNKIYVSMWQLNMFYQS